MDDKEISSIFRQFADRIIALELKVGKLEEGTHNINYSFSINSRTVTEETLQQMEERAIKDLGLTKKEVTPYTFNAIFGRADTNE